ncbi:MAG: cyclomaltodextrinase N-terminal domain-containing protein, partial [Flavitalea sp.]
MYMILQIRKSMLLNTSYMKNYLFILFAFLGLQSFAQTKSYPTHWWIGMKNPKLQIMLRSTEGLPAKASLNYP